MDRSIEMSWIGQVDIAEEVSRNYVARQGQEGDSVKNCGGDWELAYNMTVEMQLLTNVVVPATQARVWKLRVLDWRGLALSRGQEEDTGGLETWGKHDNH